MSFKKGFKQGRNDKDELDEFYEFLGFIVGKLSNRSAITFICITTAFITIFKHIFN